MPVSIWTRPALAQSAPAGTPARPRRSRCRAGPRRRRPGPDARRRPPSTVRLARPTHQPAEVRRDAGRLRRRRRQPSRRPPRVKLPRVGVDRTALVVLQPMDRQFLAGFPAAHRPLAAIQVRSDLLPGVEAVGRGERLDLALGLHGRILDREPGTENSSDADISGQTPLWPVVSVDRPRTRGQSAAFQIRHPAADQPPVALRRRP